MQFAASLREFPTSVPQSRITRFGRKVAVPVVMSSTGIVLARLPGNFTSWGGDAMLFFFLPPILLLLLTRRSLRDFGLGLGNRRLGVIAAVIGIALSIVVVAIGAALSPGVQSYYGNRTITPGLVLSVVTYMFAWEFLMRGYVLGALEERVGFQKANILQSVIFFFAHSAKPPLEFYSTAFTGPLFGYISRRTGSVYSMVAIHTAIYLSVVYFTS